MTRYPLAGEIAPPGIQLHSNPPPLVAAAGTSDLAWAAITEHGELAALATTREEAVDAAYGAGDMPIMVEVTDAHENPVVPIKAPGRTDRARQAAGLPRLELEDVMRLSLEQAHEQLMPFLSPLLGMVVGGREIRAYETPLGAVDAMLGQNYKTGKAAPPGEAPSEVAGLTLLPADKLHHYRQMDPRGRVRAMIERELPLSSMRTFCAGSNAHCREACLVYTGRNMAEIYNRRRKAVLSVALIREPLAFCRLLVEAVQRHVRSCGSRGLMPYVRLNVLSDIPWEEVLPGLFDAVAGELMLYDYTKVAGRRPPGNYDLTYSFSGTNQQDALREIEERRRRVAVVFLGMKQGATGTWEVFKVGAQLPATFWGLPVVDGDVSDLRPLDPAPCIVGLRWKTPAGRALDPSAPEFKFVQQVYHLKGAEPVTNPGGAVEYLVAPVTPRYQPVENA